MNMIPHKSNWSVWQSNRAIIRGHLTQAWISRHKAMKFLREGNRYYARIHKQAAAYQLELARRERMGLRGVYGVHFG